MSDTMMSPDVLVAVVLRYYFESKLEWDPSRKYGDVQLLNNNETIKHTNNNWRTVVSKDMWSADKHETIKWETTVYDFNQGKGLEWLQLGFVDKSAVDDVRVHYDLGNRDRPKECAFYIRKDYFFHHQNGIYTKFPGKWKGADCVEGDRVRLCFDFDSRTLVAYYNDVLSDENDFKLIGTVSEELPREIYLVSNPSSPIRLETTKFEVIPRM